MLLAQRPEGKHLAGYWEFPGGKLAPGETPEACLIRELREGASRKDPPRKNPAPKGEASLILEAVPYVGRLFGEEKQIKKPDPKPKVSVKLDDPELESGRIKLEMKLQGKDLESLNKDLEVKTTVYAAAGIPEYWIINLKQMQLIVFRSPTNEGYQLQETWVQSVISPLAFPDIEIAVERLLNG